MPAIRDKFDFYLAATGASITLPMPSHETGDLLLAFANYDAGNVTLATATAGWTRLFTLNNGTLHSAACFYKIAASAAEPDIVITHGSTNDTMSACSISIRDVDATRWVNGTPNTGNYTVTTQASSTRALMSTISTLRDNTLVLYFLSTTATAPGVHFVENSVHELSVVDGVAEGLGLGWSFQRTQGTSPADIYFAANTADVGIKATIQIPPPSTGATVIPAYCVSDSSVYLNPNGGTAAWDGSTQMAATADTSFGTTIGGRGTNDATVAAAADIGINSFHAFMGLTNAATATTMSGAEVVIAASRYNVGNNNILCHFRHPTPANNQRLSGLANNRGVWMGMRSGPTNATNYKVWQVHGVDVPLVAGYVQPIIINAANTDQIAAAGTVDNTDVRRYGFWTGGAGTLTQQSCFGPLWSMNTFVLSGGTSTEPIGIPEIVSTAATAKERLSSILQGANQMLCYQAIQFGNGGTNPVYLDLESTAVEFPSTRNVAKKLVNYNGIANSVGFTYYGATGDTIIHRDSVVVSQSPYHWRIHPSATSGATWDFSGLSLIGAGDVVLRAVTTFTGMVFSNCDLVTQNSSTVTSCEFVDSLVLSNAPNLITNCTFTSSGTGHAIEINTPGTYSFSGNIFTGYGSTGTTNAAIYNNSGGTVTLNIVGGGNLPTYRNGTSATTTVTASYSIELTSLQANSEIRVYLGTDPATATEIAGIENSSTSFLFTHSYPGQQGYIQIINFDYQPFRLPITFTNVDREIPISQVVDRVAENPA